MNLVNVKTSKEKWIAQLNIPTQRFVSFVLLVDSNKALLAFVPLFKVAFLALAWLQRWVGELNVHAIAVSAFLNRTAAFERPLDTLFSITCLVLMTVKSEIFRTTVELLFEYQTTTKKNQE